MFAGAAREAVFSRPEVIRRVNAEFVPLAVRAPMANLIDPAGNEAEAQFYAQLKRTQAAPQGICVLNGDGQVLDWVLTFEKNSRIGEFLDYSLRRSREHPHSEARLTTRRYQQYPTQRMPDVIGVNRFGAIHAAHPSGEPCPALTRSKSAVQPGMISVSVVGRALTSTGAPSPDTVRQERYIEDHFALPAELQQAITAAARHPAERIPLPRAFGQLCATYAYLGHLDVRPLDNPRGGTGVLERSDFWAYPTQGKPGLLRVAGNTDVSGDLGGPDGHQHTVRLKWEGFLNLKGQRVTRVMLLARGTERLTYGGGLPSGGDEVAFLPGGRRVTQNTGVRYGLIGKASAGGVATSAPILKANPPTKPTLPANGMAATELMGVLGSQGVLLQPDSQAELRLSPEQRDGVQLLQGNLTRRFVELRKGLDRLPPDKREPALDSFRRDVGRMLGEAVAELLSPHQQKRLQQLVWQQEGLFALGNPDVATTLHLSEAQRKSFMAVVQETQQRFAALQRTAQESGQLEVIGREAAAIRGQQEGKIRALLTPAQLKTWQELIGEATSPK